jgi:hypothetical protein
VGAELADILLVSFPVADLSVKGALRTTDTHLQVVFNRDCAPNSLETSLVIITPDVPPLTAWTFNKAMDDHDTRKGRPT